MLFLLVLQVLPHVLAALDRHTAASASTCEQQHVHNLNERVEPQGKSGSDDVPANKGHKAARKHRHNHDSSGHVVQQ